MTSVKLGERRSIRAARRKLSEQLDVSVTPVINKPQRDYQPTFALELFTLDGLSATQGKHEQ